MLTFTLDAAVVLLSTQWKKNETKSTVRCTAGMIPYTGGFGLSQPHAADLATGPLVVQLKSVPNLEACLTRVGGGKPLSQFKHRMHAPPVADHRPRASQKITK